MSSDIQALEASLRRQDLVREQETPAEEIARLKEASQTDHFNVDREVRRSLLHNLVKLEKCLLNKNQVS